MRFKTFGISTAAFLAVGTLSVATAGHVHASNCGALPVAVTTAAPTGATGVTVCFDPNDQLGQNFHGGYLEVGEGPSGNTTYLTPQIPVGVYVVLQGASNNTDAVSAATGFADQGYIGLSNYENGTQNSGPYDSPCGTPGTSGGTNGGGSVGIDTFCTNSAVPEPIHSQGLPIPFVVCGHFSGTDWQHTDRDGCWEP